jgi:hypothetical protein
LNLQHEEEPVKPRIALALSVVCLAFVTAGSCSRNHTSSLAAGGPLSHLTAPVDAGAPPDSGHGGGPPPHPGPKPPMPAVAFVSTDSVLPGDSASTRWNLRNTAHQSFTMPWVLTSARNWPGFPKSGSVTLAALGSQLLTVGVQVPDTAAAGLAGLTMTVTSKDGTTSSASGAIVVRSP